MQVTDAEAALKAGMAKVSELESRIADAPEPVEAPPQVNALAFMKTRCECSFEYKARVPGCMHAFPSLLTCQVEGLQPYDKSTILDMRVQPACHNLVFRSERAHV